MTEYYVSGDKARECMDLPGVALADDWEDDTFDVTVDEQSEGAFVEWCEANDVIAELL